MMLPRFTLQRTSKMGIVLTLRHALRLVAAQKKKAAIFHRGLVQHIRGKRPEAAIHEAERPEVAQNELVLSSQQHGDSVRSVGEAAQGAASGVVFGTASRSFWSITR